MRDRRRLHPNQRPPAIPYSDTFLNYATGLIACVLLALIGCSWNQAPEFHTLAGQYNISPASRTLNPVSIFATHGQVTSPNAILIGGATTLSGEGSYIVFDFGKEVGGIVTVQFGSTSDDKQSLAMAFSESMLNVGMTSDLSDGGSGGDGFLPVAVSTSGSFTMPVAKLRGGFRYLTLTLTTNGSVELTGVTLQFTAAPAMLDLRAYRGAFVSNDDLLNRIWYAGAYTVQTNLIDPMQGGYGRRLQLDGSITASLAWAPRCLSTGQSATAQFGPVTSAYRQEQTMSPSAIRFQ